MPAFRFNHMELTLPQGSLDSPGGIREEIAKFYGEVFGFESLDVPILGQTGLLLRTDPETSQFLLMTQTDHPLQSPGYDHLGFLYDTRQEVDEILERCEKWKQRDDRVQLKYYEDLDTPESVVHAFYVKYLLPIWFDVQCIEYKPDAPSYRSWSFS
jgi:hypothetical protein